MMNWSSWADFVAMGGYAFYVWGSFGAVAVALALETASLRARRRALRRPRRSDRNVNFAESPHEA